MHLSIGVKHQFCASNQSKHYAAGRARQLKRACRLPLTVEQTSTFIQCLVYPPGGQLGVQPGAQPWVGCGGLQGGLQ